MKRRRVFLGATSLNIEKGGIPRVARMTARALSGGGRDVELATLLDAEPCNIASLTSRTASGSRLTYAARCHAAAFSHDWFLYDAVGVARAHPRLPGLRRPYGVWIHGVEVWDSLHADRARALRGADFVLSNSQFTLDRFQERHGPLQNAYTCWLGTEDDAPPPNAMSCFEGPPTVLMLGRIDRAHMYKGHKELIECWANVRSKVPDAKLVIAGGGDGLDTVRSMAQRSAGGGIEIRGFVAGSALPDAFRNAHVFAMPSRGEGFGIVYVEAMRHGLPVIASVHDAGQEVNVDGVTGYNVDLTRPEELADRIVALLSDTDRARRMGQAGHARWQAHFRYSRFADRFLACLDGVESGNQSSIERGPKPIGASDAA